MPQVLPTPLPRAGLPRSVRIPALIMSILSLAPLEADGQGFEGLRQIGTALSEALGAVVQPRTPTSDSSSSNSGSG